VTRCGKIVVALKETMGPVVEIDEIVPQRPIE
jgi:hypothetical protein